MGNDIVPYPLKGAICGDDMRKCGCVFGMGRVYWCDCITTGTTGFISLLFLKYRQAFKAYLR